MAVLPQDSRIAPITMKSIYDKAMRGEKMIEPTPVKQAYYDRFRAESQGYNPNNYQKGYGIGDALNISGGFNRFNDTNSVRQELDRVNTVMQNRSKFGLGNDAFQSYYQKLQSAIAPELQAQQRAQDALSRFESQYAQARQNFENQFNQYNQRIDSVRNDFYKGKAYQNYQRMIDATIDDISKKYGFDFSREYAERQAEAEAQALRDANADAQRKNKSQNELNLAKIDAGLMNMAEALDRNYFQQMMQQQQNQVNTGLNAGIAADQDLRLQMARQADMASSYRDANLGRMQEQQRFTNEDLRLIEALGTINQQAKARAEALYNDRLMMGYDVLNQDRNFALGAANTEWGWANELVNQYLNQQGRLTDNYQWQSAFDYNAMRDIIGDTQFDRDLFLRQQSQSLAADQWAKEFERSLNRDAVSDRQWQQQFDWNKLMDEAGLTGYYNKQRTLQGQQFDWSKLVDEAGLTGMYNGEKTWERQLAEAELALQRMSLASRGSGGGGGGGGRRTRYKSPGSTKSSSPSSAKSTASDLYQRYKQDKLGTPLNATDAYYMKRLNNLGQDLMNTYAQLKNGPRVKSSTDKITEALMDSYLAPQNTPPIDKVRNYLKALR